MLSLAASAIFAASLAGTASAECANACSGHGACTSYDMCICNANWQGNDCSQRTCQFGIAHVDTPKGDLDGSGALTGPDHPIVDNHPVYPYGTTEQFPQMEDSDLVPLTNSAHYYMECSNKGTCNRQTGECQCYDGYDGAACERASCPGFPNSCSGHGTCKTISQLAQADHGNVYKLWDRESTMGCDCDPGYYGPDCSLRDCKYGVDPLYLDDAATAKVGIYDFAVLTTGTVFSDGMSASGGANGQWAIRFFDSHGEDWLTTALPAWATCDEVIAALEGLPNNVIPANSITCNNLQYTTGTNSLRWLDTDTTTHAGHTYHLWYKMAVSTAIADPDLNIGPSSWEAKASRSVSMGKAPSFAGNIYRIKFTENPGALKEPQIELYLDGKRPSLIGYGDKVIVTFVVTDGQQGEDTDYFADHCDGVTVTIDNSTLTEVSPTSYVQLGGLNTAETKLLKSCLGDANGDDTDNSDVYDWDTGDAEYPHLIKLVRTVTTYQDGGYYAALYYTGSVFKLINPFMPPDWLDTDTYDVYTTKGTLKRTALTTKVKSYFYYGDHHLVTKSTAQEATTADRDAFSGSLACEENADTTNVANCLNHTDLFTILDYTNTASNPPYLNLYTAKRVWTTESQHTVEDVTDSLIADAATDDATLKQPLRRGTNVIETDLALNWGGNDGTTNARAYSVYKFVPHADSTYNYVAACSNRGICNTDSGICNCFPGYTNDNCDTQNSLAL